MCARTLLASLSLARSLSFTHTHTHTHTHLALRVTRGNSLALGRHFLFSHGPSDKRTRWKVLDSIAAPHRRVLRLKVRSVVQFRLRSGARQGRAEEAARGQAAEAALSTQPVRGHEGALSFEFLRGEDSWQQQQTLTTAGCGRTSAPLRAHPLSAGARADDRHHRGAQQEKRGRGCDPRHWARCCTPLRRLCGCHGLERHAGDRRTR